jgi:nitrite reductase/ring-hydroxylating ferredoxin subunit
MIVKIDGRRAVRACEAKELPAEGAFRVSFPNRPPIAIFRLDGDLFALNDTCSHGQASLCDGFVEDGKVECPFHTALFDIRTGAALTMPATEPVRAYSVMIKDGDVYILL